MNPLRQHQAAVAVVGSDSRFCGDKGGSAAGDGEVSPSWEADSSSAGQETATFYGTKMSITVVHKIHPPVPTLNQPKSILFLNDTFLKLSYPYVQAFRHVSPYKNPYALLSPIRATLKQQVSVSWVLLPVSIFD
jgi:hypothetical protein